MSNKKWATRKRPTAILAPKCVRATRRKISLLLALIMVFTSIQSVSAFAQEFDDIMPFEYVEFAEIVAFEPLASNVAEQIVPVGTDISMLSFPTTQTVTVHVTTGTALEMPVTTVPAIEIRNIDGITWVSSPPFNPNVPGLYDFTPVLPAGVLVAAGVALPIIAVHVEPSTAIPPPTIRRFDAVTRWETANLLSRGLAPRLTIGLSRPTLYVVEFDTPQNQFISQVTLVTRDGLRFPMESVGTSWMFNDTRWTTPQANSLRGNTISVEVVWQVGHYDVNFDTIVQNLFNMPNVDQNRYTDSLLMPLDVVGPGMTTRAFVLRPNEEPNRGTITPNSGVVPLAPGFTLRSYRGSDFWWIDATEEAVGRTFVFWAHANGVSEVIFATVNEPGSYRIGNLQGMNQFYFYRSFAGSARMETIRFDGRFRLVIDPSGNVFEAVPSNRLEGVRTSLYQRVGNNAVFWDAASYGQENPLFTDRTGFYQWDVPEGWWRVRYELAGYETVTSIWLPVQPEHLEVHVGLVSREAPRVRRATAFPTGVEILFSRYMTLDSLTPENITISQNGVNIPGTVYLIDRESNFLNYDYVHGIIQANGFPTPTVNVQEFASIVRFIPAQELSGEILITINGNVTSYADVAMGANFSETRTVVPEPEYMSAQTVHLRMHESGNIIVNLAPIAAVAGRTVTAVSDNPYIAPVQSRAIVASNGTAILSVNGVLPGAATITLSLEDTLLNTQVAVVVGMPPCIRELLGYDLEDLGIIEVAPTISTANNYTAISLVASSFQVEAAGSPVPTFSLVNAPTGVTIDPTTGVITIEGATAIGVHAFTIVASNSAGTVSQTFTLTVVEDYAATPNDPPIIPPSSRPPSGSWAGGSSTTSSVATGSRRTVRQPSTTSVHQVSGNGGDVQVDVRVHQNNANIRLPLATINRLISTAVENNVVLDLTQLESVQSVIIPRAAIRRFANAGLSIEVKLHHGTVILDAEAAYSLGQLAQSTTVIITVSSVDVRGLDFTEFEAVRLTITSGNQNITELDGLITLSIPSQAQVVVYRLEALLNTIQIASLFDSGLVVFATNVAGTFVIRSGYAQEMQNVTPLQEEAELPVDLPLETTSSIMIPTAPLLRLTIGSVMYQQNGVIGMAEAAPFIYEERTMVPLRLIANVLGAEPLWNESTRTVYVALNGSELSLTIDQPLPDDMGTPMIINDRTFVPMRYVSETLGAYVRWDYSASSVYLY